MVRRLILPLVLGLVVLSLGLALWSADPTTARLVGNLPTQTQTVTFTSTPPAGADWFYGSSGLGVSYLASASASSGLPVTYSVDPASSEVCRVNPTFDDPSGAQVAIQFRGPGTCTVRADQAGNGDFQPAEQAAQSFVVEKVQPQLSGLRGRKSLRLARASFRATLLVPYNVDSHSVGRRGYPRQLVTFSVAGRPVCSGTTNADGVATCTASLRPAVWATRLRCAAAYAGDARYQATTARGTFVG